MFLSDLLKRNLIAYISVHYSQAEEDDRLHERQATNPEDEQILHRQEEAAEEEEKGLF